MVRSKAIALSPSAATLRVHLVRILDAAVAAVEPGHLTTNALARHPLLRSSDPITLVAAGKAAWPMLQSACHVLGDRLRAGVGTGRRGEGALPDAVRWFEGGHPKPTQDSVRAGEAALSEAEDAGRSGGLLLVLLSGGASAMLAAPVDAVSIADKAAAADTLMRAGRTIGDLNCVRKHLSRVKGGLLAGAAGRVLTLAISDVHLPEDDPATIGSGPTAADPTTFAEALEIVRGLEMPPTVLTHLRRGAAGEVPETVKPGDPRLAAAEWQVIANRHTATEGAAHEARRLGYQVHVVRPATHGEARDAGRIFVEMALETAPLAGPMCVIGSGETTVTVRGHGHGGRNQEFVLGAAEFLDGREDVLFASMGTDGLDGVTDAAGGVVSGATWAEARRLGIGVDDVLGRNDSYTLLAALDDLIEWGPTLTNVGDIHVLLRI